MSEASHDQAQAELFGAFFGELPRLDVEGKNFVVERYSGEERVERFGDLAGVKPIRKELIVLPDGVSGQRTIDDVFTGRAGYSGDALARHRQSRKASSARNHARWTFVGP